MKTNCRISKVISTQQRPRYSFQLKAVIKSPDFAFSLFGINYKSIFTFLLSTHLIFFSDMHFVYMTSHPADLNWSFLVVVQHGKTFTSVKLIFLFLFMNFIYCLDSICKMYPSILRMNEQKMQFIKSICWCGEF